ncbi:MAG: radical SAM protein [Hyphomonadaceae bacterium]
MKAAPIYAHADIRGGEDVRILKVVELPEAEAGDWPRDKLLIWNAHASPDFAGSLSTSRDVFRGSVAVAGLSGANTVGPGDVVRLDPANQQISILYRRGSNANAFIVTDRCNSLCLMCSHPPKPENDGWRLGDIIQTAALVDRNESQIAFTGGEPTLLGQAFASVLSVCGAFLPDTQFHILTNGRRLSDPELAQMLVAAAGRQALWVVPLHADKAAVHDDIAGVHGAFEETLLGLKELARQQARVKVRVVVHAMNLPHLPQLAARICSEFPFVGGIDFAGLEPIGLARVFSDRLRVDPAPYSAALENVVLDLAAKGLAVSLSNLAACDLPPSLQRFAKGSSAPSPAYAHFIQMRGGAIGKTHSAGHAAQGQAARG